MLEQTRDCQIPWQWVTRLPGDYGTVIVSFPTEAAARVYGRREGWCG